MNVNRPKVDYRIYALGMLVGAIGIAISIAAFRFLLLRSAGIAICLLGVYIATRLSLPKEVRNQRPVAPPVDRRIKLYFAVAFGLSIVTYAVLYVVPGNIVGVIVLYSFVVFAMLTGLIGSYLMARWIRRVFC
jgi:hypothetical protein